MAKQLSKPARWAKACAEGKDLVAKLDDVLTDLRDLLSEYEEWRDNMPESLQESATYEKLEEVIDESESQFDELESAKDQVETALDEIEAMDLPRGFGRD